MRTILIIICCCVMSITGSAQMIDSISKSFSYKPKPLLKLETRNSFITSEIVKVRAIKVGLNFNNTSRIGLSYNWLKRNTLITTRDNSVLKMNYISPFYEYVFYRDKHFTMAIPVLIGIGNARYVSQNKVKYNKTRLFTYEPGLTVEYKFLRYFGIGTGIGIRLAIKDDKRITEQLNSPIYILKFKIYFSDIVGDLF